MGEFWDCLVVGAGPAGLTAGLYLGRYRRRVMVADGGPPRAALIPTSHNMAGFPDGISGPDLLDRMRTHAGRYGAKVVPGFVTAVEASAEGFTAWLGGEAVGARTIILATGVVDVEPPLPDLEGGIRRGLIHHCPICDGYEVMGQRVGVIGFGAGASGEARFLRTWSDDVTLLTLAVPMTLTRAEARRLKAAGIRIVGEKVRKVTLAGGHIAGIETDGGACLAFDTLYSALGARNCSDLAARLGAKCEEDGAVRTNARQETSVRGVYAIGDVTAALNQVAVATSQAAIAATAVHRALSTR